MGKSIGWFNLLCLLRMNATITFKIWLIPSNGSNCEHCYNRWFINIITFHVKLHFNFYLISHSNYRYQSIWILHLSDYKRIFQKLYLFINLPSGLIWFGCKINGLFDDKLVCVVGYGLMSQVELAVCVKSPVKFPWVSTTWRETWLANPSWL